VTARAGVGDDDAMEGLVASVDGTVVCIAVADTGGSEIRG